MDTKNIASEIIRRLIEYNEPVTNWKVLLQQMRSDGFDIDKPGMNLLLSKIEKDGWIARSNADTITLERKGDYLEWINDQSLDNALANPIQKNKRIHTNSIKSTSWLEVLYWVSGIILAIIALITFFKN